MSLVTLPLVTFFMYQRFVLDNGLRVLISELPHTRSVTLTIHVAIGARYEEAAQSGISHFIEHMLFKGTEKRPSAQELALAIESLGGAFNAATGYELTNYWVKLAYQHFDTALDVLTDMLKRSRFEVEEIEKERRVIIEEINQTFDAPDELVFFDLDQLMWPDHPLGRDIAGSAETVSALDRAQMRDYLARHYRASNIVVSAAGFLETEPALQQIAAALGELQPTPRPEYLRFQNGQHAPRWHVRYRNTEQAHVVVTTWAFPRLHPDRYVISVLNTILGEGMSSRLFQEIREKRGLAYSVSSYSSALEDCGYFGSYAAVDPKNAPATLAAVLAEWARLRDEPVPAEELTKAKELMKGHLLLSMEDTHAIAGWYARQEALGHEILTVDDVTAGIEAVTTEDVQRVAREIFHSEALNLAVVGPFKSESKFVRALKI